MKERKLFTPSEVKKKVDERLKKQEEIILEKITGDLDHTISEKGYMLYLDGKIEVSDAIMDFSTEDIKPELREEIQKRVSKRVIEYLEEYRWKIEKDEEGKYFLTEM